MPRRMLLVLLTLIAVLLPGLAAAQQEQICFNNIPGVTNCIGGRFASFWRENGGLPVFGMPISAERLEQNEGRSYTVQYFERNRFEYHPENAAPYDVLLGRLGAARLQQQGRDWLRFASVAAAPGERCWYSADTRHAVCGDFYDYFRNHGLEFDGQEGFGPSESLALFGLPLSEPQVETSAQGEAILTQWFERARFEFHPNNPPEYRVLLGLLGNETYRPATSAPTPSATATPTPTPSATPTPHHDDDDDNGPDWTTQTGIVGDLDPNGYFSLDSGQGRWGVRFGSRTNIIHEDGSRASSAELYNGRQVLARGPISRKGEIEARTIKLYGGAPAPAPPPAATATTVPGAPPSTVPGVIIAVDYVNKIFLLKSTLDANGIGVRYADSTTIVFDNGQAAGVANLAPGTWLTAQGNIVEGALKANAIVLRRVPPTLRRDAELISLDAAVLDATPQLGIFSVVIADGRRFVVVYGGYTNFARAKGGKASPADLVPGRQVQLRVQVDPLGALVARSVKVFK